VTAPATASALYRGTVRHRRFGPVPHTFERPIVLTLLDLGEAGALVDRLPLWSRRRWAPVQFRRRDYLDGSATSPLAEAVGDVVEERLGRRPRGPVRVLTHLRTWGWLFNPITVYWCFEPDGTTLDVVVLEVTNTPWREREHYVVAATSVTGRGVVFPKTLHVSPFLDEDVDYRLSFAAPDTAPGSSLDLRLEVLRDGRKVFDADLWLTRTELTTRNALAAVFRRPFETMRVSLAIYRQAARLTAKGVAFVAHPDRHPTTRRPRP
jgi:DUF1365 family protein